jgi:hypothetical protein
MCVALEERMTLSRKKRDSAMCVAIQLEKNVTDAAIEK